MNRMEEYQRLAEELEDAVPGLEQSLRKAKYRRLCRNIIWRPLTGLAAVFALFVVLVNVSTPVANACSQIPILRRLAEAVTFHQSLQDAVEHEYAQVMDLSQTDGDVTATVEYLIADKSKLYIFFRIQTDEEMPIMTDGTVSYQYSILPRGAEKIQEEGCHGLGWHNFEVLENGLRMAELEFIGQARHAIINQVSFQLNVYAADYTKMDHFWEMENLGEPVAKFDFELEYDPDLIAHSKTVFVDQSFELDGETFTVEKVEIHPTHMKVQLSEDPRNTRNLDGLGFYVESEDGTRFAKSGDASSGGPWESILQYELASPYFYDVEGMRLVVTSAVWIDKEKQSAQVDMIGEKAESLPEGWEFLSAQKYSDEWLLILREPYEENRKEMIALDYKCYDPNGKEWHMQSDFQMGEPDAEGEITYMLRTIRLKGYPFGEITLNFKHMTRFAADTPIVIPIQ